MELPLPNIIDRITILKLKIERIGGNRFDAEMVAFQEALEDFKKRGVKVDPHWVDNLYQINMEEWDLLEKMNHEKKSGCDYSKIGKLYIETELVNKRRSEAMNMIVEKTGSGFKEIKKNHPSE